ncbi:MAG: hypothetical protein K0R22_1929 [Sporomusa sp.]|jgi:hypothetical protein|nr:hypothetical protein [Sporomusa sp.]
MTGKIRGANFLLLGQKMKRACYHCHLFVVQCCTIISRELTVSVSTNAIKPEIEVFDAAMINNAVNLQKAGLLIGPKGITAGHCQKSILSDR